MGAPQAVEIDEVPAREYVFVDEWDVDAPIEPEPPGRLSTMNCCLNLSDNNFEKSRACVSVTTISSANTSRCIAPARRMKKR